VNRSCFNLHSHRIAAQEERDLGVDNEMDLMIIARGHVLHVFQSVGGTGN
jgi:hypothetical protein